MNPSVVIAIVSIIIGVLLAVLSHIIVSVWWASKITTTLGFLRESLEKIEKHQDGYYKKEEAIKEFANIQRELKASWEKLDDSRHRIEKLETEVAVLKGS